ncbi:MAG: transposase [Chloroflexia bacterium]|nr:transposase [Chloroflexia bacterium]
MPIHHPPHVYLDDSWHILSASTINHARYLNSTEVKSLVRDKMVDLVQKFSMSLRAWVILDNHYPLLLKTRSGHDLSAFFSQLHGGTSYQLNRRDRATGRQLWHNYWDTCIHDEHGIWTRFNYIHYNPVKHGYVQDPAEWPFSSYHYYLRTEGREWLDECLSRYPLIAHLECDDWGHSEPAKASTPG